MVRKSLIREALRAVLKAGNDLTRYSWIVERIGDRYHFTFEPRSIEDPWESEGGAITVMVSVASGRRVGRLMYSE